MRAQAGAKEAAQEAQEEPPLMEQMLREQMLRGALEPAPETRGYAVRSAGASARAPHRAPRTLRDYPVGQWACVPRRNHLGLGFSTWCPPRPPQAARTAQRHSGGHHTCLLALVSRLGPPELPWAEVPWAEVPWAEVPWLEVAHVRPKCASRRAAEGSGVARV